MEYGEEYYRARFRNLLGQGYEIQSAVEIERRFGDLRLSGKILEFGCGLGQNIYGFSERVGLAYGRFSYEFCAGKGIPVVQSLSEIYSQRFDFIIMSHVLEHMPDPLQTLRSLRPLLKKGGKLILVIPKEEHSKPMPRPSADTWDHHLFAWNFQSLHNLLDDAGFRTVQDKYIPFVTGARKGLVLFKKFPRLFLFLGTFAYKVVALFSGRPFYEIRIVAEAVKEKEA